MDVSKMIPPRPDSTLPELTEEERATYAWQFDVEGFGELGQRRLKGASVLISRIGGLGGMVALELAAAGVGRLILAHGGNIRPSDLNRQVLMTQDRIGTSRMDSAIARLRALNPRLEIVAEHANVSEENAHRLVEQADVVVDCAPLFVERYALNRAAMALRRPMVEAAVYDLEFHLTTFVPGVTGCLRCLYPEPSTTWRRQFPVLGAVPGVAGSMAALEVIKLIARFGDTLANRLLVYDLRSVQMNKLRLQRVAGCPDCSHL